MHMYIWCARCHAGKWSQNVRNWALLSFLLYENDTSMIRRVWWRKKSIISNGLMKLYAAFFERFWMKFDNSHSYQHVLIFSKPTSFCCSEPTKNGFTRTSLNYKWKDLRVRVLQSCFCWMCPMSSTFLLKLSVGISFSFYTLIFIELYVISLGNLITMFFFIKRIDL